MDYFQPASPALSTVSISQQHSESQEEYINHNLFDAHYKWPQALESDQSILSNPSTSPYIYNPDHYALPKADAAAYHHAPLQVFEMQPQHTDQWQRTISNDALRLPGSLTAPHITTPGFRGSSDSEEEEDFSFGDHELEMLPDFSRPPLEKSHDEIAGVDGLLQRENLSARQINSQFRRYPDLPPGEQLTVGSPMSELMSSPIIWDESDHASDAMASHRSQSGNDDKQKIHQVVSAHNTILPGQDNDTFEPSMQWESSSQPDFPGSVSRFGSTTPDQPSSPSMTGSSTNLVGPVQIDIGIPTTCSNCFTRTTPLWRRSLDGRTMCNACGLYLRLHGSSRPLSLKTDIIKKRNRISIASFSLSDRGASTRAAKKCRAASGNNTSKRTRCALTSENFPDVLKVDR